MTKLLDDCLDSKLSQSERVILQKAKSDLEKLAKLDLIEIKSLNKDYASYDSVVLVGENEDENMKNSFEVKEKILSLN